MGCWDSSSGLVACFFVSSSSSSIHFNIRNTTTEHRSVHLSLAMHNGHNYTNRHRCTVCAYIIIIRKDTQTVTQIH